MQGTTPFCRKSSFISCPSAATWADCVSASTGGLWVPQWSKHGPYGNAAVFTYQWGRSPMSDQEIPKSVWGHVLTCQIWGPREQTLLRAQIWLITVY